MEIPSFLMSKTVLAGAGAVGTAAMGTITVQMSRGPYSFDPNKLSKFRWTFRTDPKRRNLDLIGGDCVQNFFPEFAYPTEKQMEKPRSSDSKIAKPSLQVTDKSNLMGCKLIKFTRADGPNNHKIFTYKSEITARSDKNGLILSTVISQTSEKAALEYKFWLLYLKKDKDLWKLDWEHEFKNHGTVTIPTTNPFSFAIPRINREFSMVEVSSTSPHNNFHDSWIWTFADNGDSPLFYHSSHNKGSNTERNWFMEQNADALKVYTPLKDLKGTWKRTKDYCDSFNPSAFPSPEKIPETARDLCYTRNY